MRGYIVVNGASKINFLLVVVKSSYHNQKMPGKFLNERCQELVLNVYEYFCRERENFGPLCNVEGVLRRTSEALKINVNSLKKCIESKKTETPLPKVIKKPRKKHKTDDISEGLKHTIRDIVYDLYHQKKVVNLETLRKLLQEKELLEVSRPTMGKILNNIGFKFKKDCNRRALCERKNVASARVQFLKSYNENLKSSSPLPVVFLDETWIFSRGSQKRSWQDDTPKSVKNPEYSSTGKRYIILHAGNRNGFIDNCSLVFAAHSKASDYHDNMDAVTFENWLKDQLLPNLHEPSLIILDNASYHSRLVEKMPSGAWLKDELKNWLIAKNIPFSSTDLKIDLLNITKKYPFKKQYIVDNIIQEHGHFILRLPPYHCQFNAIENIWGICKTHYDKHIGRDGYSDVAVLQMWKESLEKCDAEVWEKTISHTEKIISEWWLREKLLDVTVVPLVISVNDSDSGDEETDSLE